MDETASRNKAVNSPADRLTPASQDAPADPAARRELTADEALLLIAVRGNDLRLFLSAIEKRGWLDDSKMMLCRAVHTNDLRLFLTALDIHGVLAKRAAEETDR